MNFVGRTTGICDTAELKRHVITLYCEVFEFLCHTMKWYSSAWNRFLKAYNGKFYDEKIRGRIQKIQGLVQRVRDELKLSTGRSVQTIRVEQHTNFLQMNSRLDTLEDTIDEKLEEKLQAFALDVGRSLRELGPAVALQLMSHCQHGKSTFHGIYNVDFEANKYLIELTSPEMLMMQSPESTPRQVTGMASSEMDGEMEG